MNSLQHSLKLAAFSLVMLLPFVSGAQTAAEVEADQERIKRMEANLLLNQSMDEAEKLVRAGELAKAKNRYEEVLEKTSPLGPDKEIHTRARLRLASLIAAEAQDAMRNGEITKARSLANEALGLDPGNPAYEKLAREAANRAPTVQERYPESRVADQALQDKVDRIAQLLLEGDAFFKTGQYSRAEGIYNEIMKIDPYNQTAIKRLEKLVDKKAEAAKVRRQAFRVKKMADVTRNWDMRPKRRTNIEPEIQTDTFEVSRVNQIFDKLESIVIPELKFTDVDIADAVRFLQEQSKALDPEGEGVNFVLKAETTASVDGGEGDGGNQELLRTLTLDVRDLPLIKVLEFIDQLTGLKYKVEEYAVYIFPETETSDVKVVRSFSVPPTFFSNVVEPEGDIVGADVKKELEDKGVDFPAGTSAAYLQKTAKLVVRNTLEQISLIEQLVAKEAVETTQISIEAKFLEFTEDQLKDFSSNLSISADANIPDLVSNGFVPPVGRDANGDEFPDFEGDFDGDGIPDNVDLDPAPEQASDGMGKIRAGFGTDLRNAGALPPNQIDQLLNRGITRNPAQLGFTAVLGDNGFRYLLSALESTIAGDLMSAPKVTLLNGQQSKVRIVREFYYPEEYEPPEVDLVTSDGGADAISLISVVPSTPTEFITRDIGVTLEVKANATPDRRIDLELTPEVIEFQGFIDYGSDINTSGANSGQVQFVTRASNLRPVFSRRSVETKMQVIDGQTVVMAGFIRDDEEEIEDRVPFLGDLPLVGRAFRSKSSQSIKRNLIMFITARMVNPDGTPKFLTEEEAASFGLNSAQPDNEL